MAAGRIVLAEYMPARDRYDELVAGAKLFVYENGTTTLASIFSDAGLTVPAANPIVANGSGQFPTRWAVRGSLDDPTLYSLSITGPDGESIGNPSTFDNYGPSANEEASESAAIASDSAAQAAADANAAQAALDSALVAKAQAQAGAADAEQAKVDAQSAAVNATAASLASGYYPNARSHVPQGATGHEAIDGGSGGTNGTFALAFTGGNFSINPSGTFTVSGGGVTALTLTGPGLYVGASPTAPSPDFSASSGLTAASASLTVGVLVPSGRFYWTDHETDADLTALYANVSGTATATSPLVTWPRNIDAVEADVGELKARIITSEDDPNWKWAVVVGADDIPIGVRADGRTYGRDLDQQFADPRFPDIWQFLGVGQSLMEGSDAFPVVSYLDTGWGNLMFSRGDRTWDAFDHPHDPENRAGFGLKPMTQIAAGGLGETIFNGFADALKARLAGGIYANKPQAEVRPFILGSAAVRGSLRITAINKADDTGNAPNGTSTTSLTISTGTKTLTTQPGLSYVTGDPVRIERAGNPQHFMSGGKVQTYNSGTGEMAVQGIDYPSGNSLTFASWRLVPDFHSAPGNYYATALDDVARANAAAKARLLTHAVGAVLFMQGERNSDLWIWETDSLRVNGATNPASDALSTALVSYRDKLIELADDYDTDIRVITEQPRRIPFITYQTIGVMGQAQLDAAEAHPDIYCAGPHYHLPRGTDAKRGSGNPGQVWGAAVHLHGDSSRAYGEIMARAAHRVLVEGRAWKPLQPVEAEKTSDTTVEVRFHVPSPPLVLDTSWMAKTAGWGFVARNGTIDAPGAGQTPTNVEVIGPDRLRLTFASSLAAGAALYGVDSSTVDIGSTPTVASAGSGSNTSDNWPTHTITIASDLMEALGPLIRHGSFQVRNNSGGVAIIRSVHLSGGNTVLTGEVRERTGAAFSNGQTLTFLHMTLAANVRDSADDLALYGWSDPLYPDRTGRYPLHNWMCLFLHFPIRGA